ncbi:MAG: carboxypeptidase-like regulatory domain-containing protein [Bryobacteraceae bacterium]
MKVLLLFSLSAGLLSASIDGTVVNRTSGKPQPGVSITLVKPGQGGMQTLGNTVSDASGHFVFDKDQPGGGPQLLQASYKGVNYNKLMTPNIPASNVELDVYEATKSPSVAHIAQQMLIIEPSTSRIAVTETVVVQNDTTTTYNNDSLGALRFYLPPSANGQVRINAQSQQGMPLPRPAEKTEQTDVFKVDFPIKPGQTQFEVNYVLPAGSPFTFRGRVVNVKGMPSGPLRLVVPSGVTLAGKDIQSVGTEPKTQATIYNVVAPADFAVDVTGAGSLRGGDEANAVDDSDSPPVTEGRPRIYTHLVWLIAVIFSILGVGIILLFRNSPIRS